jgi:hypothetical protein
VDGFLSDTKALMRVVITEKHKEPICSSDTAPVIESMVFLEWVEEHLIRIVGTATAAVLVTQDNLLLLTDKEKNYV